jgi:biopolymer transport protein TolR
MSRRHSKKPIAQINVVPYIDVMLVLLVIFMITAPLLTQGVQVELPQASAEPLNSQDDEPLVVSVDSRGLLYINIGGDDKTPTSAEDIQLRVAAVLRNNPKKPVMVRGDKSVDYGSVIEAMVLLQAAGAPSVGLITESPETK